MPSAKGGENGLPRVVVSVAKDSLAYFLTVARHLGTSGGIAFVGSQFAFCGY